MYENILEHTGLTKNESASYLALLKKGKSTAYQIVREAHVSSGKIYETLDKLLSKGLIKTVVENGVKKFIANEPESLFAYLKQKEVDLRRKEEELQRVLPQLKNLQLQEELDEVALQKGFRGIGPLVHQLLRTSTVLPIRIMGLRSTKNTKFNNFWMKWHRERVLEKKKARVIFSDKGSKYWKFFKNLPHTEVKESLTLSPSAIMIIGNNTLIFSYDQEFTCIHITSASVAKSFNGFFDSLWAMH